MGHDPTEEVGGSQLVGRDPREKFHREEGRFPIGGS